MNITPIRCVWGILLALSFGTWAQETPAPPIVEAIELRNLTLVSDALVHAQIESDIGEPLSPRTIARDIRRLTKLGLFTNIEVHLESIQNKSTLIYQFTEERTIDEIVIMGSKKLKESDIRAVLSSLEGDGFYEEAYETEHRAVLDLYKEKGFLNASLDIRIEDLGATGIRVSYLIIEGKKSRIKSVKFTGNNRFSTRKLRRITKTSNGFLFIGGKYNEERFEDDLKAIIDQYGDVGRLEAQVNSTDFTYQRKGKKVVITINLAEGPEYTLSDLILADHHVFTKSELTDLIEIQPSLVHDKSQVEADAKTLQDLYNDNGYVNARVTPIVTLDYENHTTNITHQIRESDLKYINKVTITGNSTTKDQVARRNVLIVPGERYDGSLLRKSINDLNRSRYFEAIRPSIEDVPGDNRFVDLLMDVDEGNKGNFNFGMGVNSDTGIGGFGQLRLTNFDIGNPPTFTGGGQQFAVTANIGDYNTQYRLSFTDPEFMGYPISVGIEVFDDHFESRGGSEYTIEQQGARLRFGKKMSNDITLRTSIGYADVEISDLETFVDPELRELESPGDTITWSWAIVRDTADHYLDPTTGTRTELKVEYAGFGGENEFVRVMTDATWYHGFKKRNKWSVSLNNREGWAQSLGEKQFVPLSSRFFGGGGTTIRGYNNRDVGPKGQTFEDIMGTLFYDEEAIGGEFRILNTLEAKYKINDTIRGYTFLDAGGVWWEAQDFDTKDFKFSVGVGIGMQIPFLGPLRVDYGFPINPDGDQGSGKLHLQSLIDF